MTLKKARFTQRYHWHPPKYLLRYRVNIGKVGSISKCRESVVPDDPIDLRLSLTLNLRMRHHRQIERMDYGHSLSENMPPGFISVSPERRKQGEDHLTVSAPPA